jgi:hypothetical protein
MKKEAQQLPSNNNFKHPMMTTLPETSSVM